MRLFPRDHFFLQSACAQLLRAPSEDLTDLLEQLPEAGGAQGAASRDKQDTGQGLLRPQLEPNAHDTL
jgi:hypothetical protein